MTSSLTTLTSGELDALADTSTTPVLIDFYADWCRPCIELEPELEKTAETFAGALTIVRVDIEADKTIHKRFGVTGFPTLALLNNNHIVARISGFREAAQLIDELRGLLDIATGEQVPAKPAAQATPAGQPETPSTNTRTLEFPEQTDVRLRIFPPGGKPYALPATGQVDVPIDADLTLIVRSESSPDLSWLSDLPPDAVSGLSLYAEVDDAALAPVEHLRGLTQITISSEALTGPGLAAIANLPRLERLNLTCPALTDPAGAIMGGISSLRELAIARAEDFGDTGVSSLAALKELTSLWLCAHAATDEGMNRLLSQLTGLKGLHLCVSGLTDRALGHIAELTTLTWLGLVAPEVTVDGLVELATLTELTRLNLYEIQADEQAVRAIASLPRLTGVVLPEHAATAHESIMLQLRAARPEVEINGVWLAAEAVQARVAALSEA